MKNFAATSLMYAALLGSLTLGTGCQPASEPEIHQGRTDSTMNTTSSGTATSAVTGKPAVPESGAPSGSPASDNGGPPMGMMTQDPRSITQIEGKIVQVDASQMLVNKGTVTLKFKLTDKTVVKPDGKKLAADQSVKIQIDQVPDGMAAKEVDIQ